MKAKNKSGFSIGDSVKVIEGAFAPGCDGYYLGGLQGRIIGVDNHCRNCDDYDKCKEDVKDIDYYVVEFDSISLRQMKKKYIKQCIEDENDFAISVFEAEELVIATERDTIEETRTAKLAIRAKFGFSNELELPEKNKHIINPEKNTRERKLEFDDKSLKKNVRILVEALPPKVKEELLNYLLKEKAENKKKTGQSSTQSKSPKIAKSKLKTPDPKAKNNISRRK